MTDKSDFIICAECANYTTALSIDRNMRICPYVNIPITPDTEGDECIKIGFFRNRN